MSSSQNNFTGTITQQDSNLVNIINRTIGNFTFSGTVGWFQDGVLGDTASHSQTLPTANILQYYLKNTHATAIITLTWTLQGGSSQSILAVQPGQVVVFWSPVTAGNAGVTAISLQSNASGATYEQFLGG